MPAWLTSLLAALAPIAQAIASAVRRTPPPPVGKPRTPGWAEIEAREDAAADTRRTGATGPKP